MIEYSNSFSFPINPSYLLILYLYGFGYITGSKVNGGNQLICISPFSVVVFSILTLLIIGASASNIIHTSSET